MAEKTTPFEHARETLSGYYDHGIRNDAVDLDADARQLVIDMGHLIAAFHAERTEATAAPGDLAALAKELHDEAASILGSDFSPSVGGLRRRLRTLADRLAAHRCPPAVEVGAGDLDTLERRWRRRADDTSLDPDQARAFDTAADELAEARAPAPAAPQASEAASGELFEGWARKYGVSAARTLAKEFAALRDATPAPAVDGYIIAGPEQDGRMAADWDGQVHATEEGGAVELLACRRAGYADWRLYALHPVADPPPVQ